MSDTTELVDLAVIFPDLEIELKYACADNITGKAIYQQARCLLHKDAITALAKSISIAQLSGLQLVIYDAYRPQQAQAMLWQACPDPQYVVDVTVGSNHSRGTAIDLTLRDEHGNILDMGAGFDEMHERSHAYHPSVPPAAQRNRLLLNAILTGGGFLRFLGGGGGGRSLRFLSRWGGDEPATQIVLLFLLPFASYLIAEHIGVSGILAAVAAGMTITRSGVMRRAPLAMRLRANSTWAMLEFVFNGMVFLLLGLQLPGILETSLMAAEIDPNVEIWMLFTDIILIYAALMLVRFGWLWTMKKFSNRFLKKKPMEFGSWTTREILIASFAGVRGAITLAGVLSIPLLLPDGNVFPARYELVFLAAGVILFSLFVGVVMLPILLQHIEVADHSQQLKEERIARAATAEVAIVAIQKMEERLAADTEENIDNQLLTEVSSRVIGNLRRRADGRNDVESSVQEENLERRFRLAALRSERAELYHLRATREISNETLQKLLHDLDLLEALLIEENQ
ncbi:Na+/H+ antiporter [Escherichia coli]|nr:Na+/H+ antiporter [Escherichia coli]